MSVDKDLSDDTLSLQREKIGQHAAPICLTPAVCGLWDMCG